MGDALKGPQVIETDVAVLVAFAVIPVAGVATCLGNRSTSVTIELSDPLASVGCMTGSSSRPSPLSQLLATPLTSTEHREGASLQVVGL